MDKYREKIEHIKNIEEATDALSKTLSIHDRYSISVMSITDIYNWVLTISIGSFLWLITNFNQFIVDGAFPNKSLFIVSLIFLGISAFLIAIGRLLLFFREQSMNKAIEGSKNIIPKILLYKDSMSKEEQAKYIKSTLSDNTDLWFSAHNLIPTINKPLKYGSILYGIGLGLISVYVFIFLIKL